MVERPVSLASDGREEMHRRQPNPRIRTRADLNQRDGEHYDVARFLGSSFTRSDFLERYRVMFPNRTPGSILPSDYCFNQENKGNALYPRFLLAEGRGLFLFVGLDGIGDTGTAPTHSPAGANASVGEKAQPHSSAGVQLRRSDGPHSSRLFVPSSGRPLAIRRDVATEAIQAYNADADVLRQERQAHAALGQGFVSGAVLGQLRSLNSAYRTRSSDDDLVIVAGAIEVRFDDWSGRIAASPDLATRVPTHSDLLELLRPFLGSPTKKQPRSLATKALHFARPQTFIPADSYAVGRLGEELRAGSWADTDGMDLEAMATWYGSYLLVIHHIGVANSGLMGELLDLDRRTGRQPFFERVRGLPKILDKVTWWLGRELRRGRHVALFEEG